MTALARLAAMRCPLDWRIGAYAAICGAPCEPIDAHTRLQYLRATSPASKWPHSTTTCEGAQP